VIELLRLYENRLHESSGQGNIIKHESPKIQSPE
jgi:hypothetical protein